MQVGKRNVRIIKRRKKKNCTQTLDVNRVFIPKQSKHEQGCRSILANGINESNQHNKLKLQAKKSLCKLIEQVIYSNTNICSIDERNKTCHLIFHAKKGKLKHMSKQNQRTSERM